MKTIFRVLLVTLISGTAYAQNLDSLTFAKAKWDKKSIAKKTKIYTHQFADSSLFKANQYISFIEVKDHKKAPGFFLAYEKKQLVTTSDFGTKNNAIAAINGNFFNVKEGGSVDFLKVNDTIINQNREDKTRAVHQKAGIVINNNKLNIKKWDGTPNWENQLTDKNIMLTGPLLILNDNPEKQSAMEFNKVRHPRSAMGVRPDGTVIMLTVDGRSSNSFGLSMAELMKVMKWLGCTDAINLDGGGSTTLWAKEYGENGVINHPSDNKKWDHEGQRKVANVIYIKAKP